MAVVHRGITVACHCDADGGEASLLLDKSADISMIVCWASATWLLDMDAGIILLKD